ncbi:magnesium transporter [Xylella fastidiosa subsp. multiplex]|uniref:Magnesium transporter n=1 Tax=Xylella fastidiosa subsp. multiplex TaxID=644357 RepID=A0A9Q4MKT2_XYLFS|nr:magnesium transporter [Xylella fastidiosa subsp. multiplex Griffin-1]MBE0268523.1 magnesium transporter [Xylella fastidiosa subsp. multiplex]MBE0275250.1 magnesium transporter [Xylella fastidiosa subsp. multiplex]MBE0277423.1 magnesium transporter [Xylella fastidiosa subsp. multiplex]MBE0281734.1 magnesium transporter [Xylella fastidiosa subsp. multiplex]
MTLTALTPTVASIGGNAGTQVLAVMVRSLALGQISTPNVLPLLKKEIAVTFINGISLNVSLGIIVLLWLKQPLLSLVIC